MKSSKLKWFYCFQKKTVNASHKFWCISVFFSLKYILVSLEISFLICMFLKLHCLISNYFRIFQLCFCWWLLVKFCWWLLVKFCCGLRAYTAWFLFKFESLTFLSSVLWPRMWSILVVWKLEKNVYSTHEFVF